MIDKENIHVFILAGGKSSRMGEEKGKVNFNDRPMIESVLDAVNKAGLSFTVIANNNQYDYLSCNIIHDEVKEKGPLGGIFTGLKNSKHDFNFFISCDLPFINAELLLFLMKEMKKDDIILVPKHDDEYEPLCGIYSRQIIDVVYDSLMKNDLVLHDLLEKLQASYAVVNDKSFYKKNMFWNINTPEELKLAKEVQNG